MWQAWKMDEIKKCVGIFKLDGERVEDSKSNWLRWPVFRENEKKKYVRNEIIISSSSSRGLFVDSRQASHFPKVCPNHMS
jgi:hypothetical protein